MVVLEAGSPVRGFEQGLQSAREVDETVAHQEEHGEKGSKNVHVAEENTTLADHHRQNKSSRRTHTLSLVQVLSNWIVLKCKCEVC